MRSREGRGPWRLNLASFSLPLSDLKNSRGCALLKPATQAIRRLVSLSRADSGSGVTACAVHVDCCVVGSGGAQQASGTYHAASRLVAAVTGLIRDRPRCLCRLHRGKDASIAGGSRAAPSAKVAAALS
mmetsp:Transcript_38392/g.65349  ORF Transcript_38392/g.65349 Transcript_38392/m.65349 type:complete len:129 (-) Transcript_38392:58-444(-)